MVIKSEYLRLEFNKARSQKRPKGRELSEQEHFCLDVIRWIYQKTGLPKSIFAKQLGISPQTVRLWLRKAGNLPAPRQIDKLMELYERNFYQDDAIRPGNGS